MALILWRERNGRQKKIQKRQEEPVPSHLGIAVIIP
jgi:hypothetical protein